MAQLAATIYQPLLLVLKNLEMDVELASNICPMGASNRPGDIGGNFNLVVCKIRTISPIAVSNETKPHRKKIIELMSIYFNGFGYADCFSIAFKTCSGARFPRRLLRRNG